MITVGVDVEGGGGMSSGNNGKDMSSGNIGRKRTVGDSWTSAKVVVRSISVRYVGVLFSPPTYDSACSYLVSGLFPRRSVDGRKTKRRSTLSLLYITKHTPTSFSEVDKTGKKDKNL